MVLLTTDKAGTEHGFPDSTAVEPQWFLPTAHPLFQSLDSDHQETAMARGLQQEEIPEVSEGHTHVSPLPMHQI